VNSRLIYVSMSGYGHNGPRRDWTSMNMNLQGYSGLMMVSGDTGDPPTAISNSWNDYIGGLHASFAILQAIDKRGATGNGALIDLSQFECSVAMIGSLLLNSAVNGTDAPRRGNRSDRCAPQGVYPCAGSDNWCSLSIQSDDEWKSMAKLIGRERWVSDQRFEDLSGRLRYHDKIDQGISAWTKQHDHNEVEARLHAVGISAERMRRIDEVVNDPDGATIFPKMVERRVGTMRTTALPFSLSFVELPAPSSAPILGEHSAEVLRGWLNYSDGEIAELEQLEALR
ncbi:MAG TPA: CaiB/BaiF CoA-transferase family protein, partial [Candidatus Binatus sp.]|nr:CaiB/BaiF CoA-transferase family protein [Candidatus Binatus sp.]